MGVDNLDTQQWQRTREGKVVLRLIEDWGSGLTEHGDVALWFTSMVGNHPGMASGEGHRSQFICTRDDAKIIAQTILRALAFARAKRTADFAAFQYRIKSPALRAVAHHWNEARGNRRMPAWEDLRPECVAPHLGAVWGFDYDPVGGAFTGRLAGSTIMYGFDRNFLGVPLRELHPPHVFEAVKAHLVRVVSDPACLRHSGKLFMANEQIFMGERLVLPMGADAEHPYGVLGVSIYEDQQALHTPGHIETLFDTPDWCRI